MTGLANTITTVAEPTIAAVEELFRHELVALLCVTGGPAVVKAAMQTGKRVIAAGPGRGGDGRRRAGHLGQLRAFPRWLDRNGLCPCQGSKR